MKDNVKMFFETGLSFGTLTGIFIGITSDLLIGIMSGIIMGILFGLIISTFLFFQGKKAMKESSEIIKGKNIIWQGMANHFKGAESVGGYLYLTTAEIIFLVS